MPVEAGGPVIMPHRAVWLRRAVPFVSSSIHSLDWR